MSRTEAQIELSRQLGSASVLIDVRNPSAIAQSLDRWLSEPNQFERSQQCAWNLAQARYNWEIEQHRFLASVERVLSSD